MGMSFLFGKKTVKTSITPAFCRISVCEESSFFSTHGSKKLNILDKKVQNNAKNVECRIKRQYLRV